MENQIIDYKLYPSILDSYLFFKKRDDDETFESLFNKINKVPTEQTEEQLKGVEFESLVNERIDHLRENGPLFYNDIIGDHYHTDNFKFKAWLVDRFVFKLQHAIARQKMISAVIPSHAGNIQLFGFVDYAFPEMDADLKTTSEYKLLKYEKHCQHKSYSLIRKLNGTPIKKFYYLPTDFERYYQEAYVPSEKMHRELLGVMFEFIGFLNHFKKYVTNEKIFGQ